MHNLLYGCTAIQLTVKPAGLSTQRYQSGSLRLIFSFASQTTTRDFNHYTYVWPCSCTARFIEPACALAADGSFKCFEIVADA